MRVIHRKIIKNKNLFNEMIQRLISHRKFKRILIFFICLLSVHVFGKLLINYLNDFDDLIMKLKSKNYKTIHMLTLICENNHLNIKEAADGVMVHVKKRFFSLILNSN